MSGIKIDKSACILCGACIGSCPFGALSIEGDTVAVSAACKVCKVCIKACPVNAISLDTGEMQAVDKSAYRGVLVVAEQNEGQLAGVSLELLGEGKKLADKIDQPLYCVIVGDDVGALAQTLSRHGADKVFVYDSSGLKYYLPQTYTNVIADLIGDVGPTVVLVGATPLGRTLAPCLSSRFATGLTADCTELDIRDNTDLVQIRPAFGGNIMAQIVSPRTRPQFATVRPKVFDAAPRSQQTTGEIVNRAVDPAFLKADAKVLSMNPKPKIVNISESEVLVAVGRGLKQKELELARELAGLLGAEMACTRPLIESGAFDYTRQIGLSGRTVKPRLIVTLGISGAIQFVAGMAGAETIIAVNCDENAPIFKTAHYGLVGDAGEILPQLIEQCKEAKAHGVS